MSHGYAISHKMLTPIFAMSPDIAANIRIPICQQSPDKLVRSLQGSQNRKVRAVSYRDWILVPQILLCTVILWAGWILNPLVNRQTIHISGQQRLESTLLVEIMAQVLESASPDFEVHRDIDEPEDLFTNLLLNKTQLYPGYPGAVQDQLSAIRKEKSSGTGAKELGNVSQLNDLLRQDEPGGHLRALEPFGFESRFVFVMMRDHVWLGQTLGTGNSQPTLTKLASILENKPILLGLPPFFSTRRDWWPYLEDHYGFNFATKVTTDNHVENYNLLENGARDVIVGYQTDPQLLEANADEKYVTFLDSNSVRLLYQALPLARAEILDEHPEIEVALRSIAGKLHQSDMVNLILKADSQLKKASVEKMESFETRTRKASISGPSGEELPTDILDSRERLKVVSEVVEEFLNDNSLITCPQWKALIPPHFEIPTPLREVFRLLPIT